MKLWKFNKRSSTLADMSMNRVLLTELIAKGAVVGVVAGFCGATYRYLILESEHFALAVDGGHYSGVGFRLAHSYGRFLPLS